MVFSESDPARGHSALKWIIRGTGALLALSSACMFIGFVSMLVVGTFSHHGLRWFAVILITGVMALLFGLSAKIGYDMFRRVDSTAVENFSFIFAALSARDFYYLAPRHLLRAMAECCMPNSHFFPPHSEHGPSSMSLLAFFSFFVFRIIYRKALLRILNLRADGRPNDPWPSSKVSDDIPEFPLKSPLIQL